MKKLIAGILIIASFNLGFSEFVFEERIYDDSSDVSNLDYYGGAVEINENYVFIGAYGYDTGSSGSGAVFIYDKNYSNSNILTLDKRIDEVAEGSVSLSTNSYLGAALAIEDDYLLIGAPERDQSTHDNLGGVYLYKLDGGTYTYEDLYYPFIGTDDQNVGKAIDIYNGFFVIGAPGFYGSAPSSGRVYYGQIVNDELIEITARSINSANENFYFGDAVAIGDGFAVIGAPGHNGSGTSTGRAYLYLVNSTTMSYVDFIEPPNSHVHQTFGRELEIYQDYVIISATGDNLAGTNSGAVYIYKFNRSSNDLDLLQTLYREELGAADRFGGSISFNYGNLVIGAPSDRSVFLYKLNTVNEEFEFVETIISSQPNTNSYYGTDVGVFEDDIIVGAYTDTSPEGSTVGVSYLYRSNFCRANSNWEINLSANLVFNDFCNITGFNLSFINSGNVTFNNTIIFDSFNNFNSDDIIYLGPNANLLMD